jgi:hypothetical protein
MPNVQPVIESDISDVSASLNQVGDVGERVNSRMASGFEHSRESARLLREETGIFLPRALQGLIAQSQVLGPLLNSAFSGLAVIGLGEVLVSVGKKVFNVAGEISGAKERMKEMEEATSALGKAQQELAEATKTYVEQLRYAGLYGSKLNEAEVADAHMQVANMQAKVAGLEALRRTVEQTSHEMVETWKGDAETGSGIWVKEMSQAAKDAEVQLKTIDMNIAIFETAVAKSNTEVLKAEDALRKAYGEETRQEIRALTEEERLNAEADRKYNEMKAKGHELLNMQMVNDMEAQQKADEYWQQQNAKGRSETLRQIDAGMMANIEADQKVAEEGQKAAQKYAEAWTHARDTMANQLDSFFNEITSGGIGKAFLKQFEKLVSQMVATWLMGVRGMGSVSRGGGIFGSLFGLGGGGAIPAGGAIDSGGGLFSGALGGGAYNFSGLGGSGGFTGADAAMLGLPLSAGGGAGSLGPATMPAGGSNAAAHVGGLGGFLGMLKGGLGTLAPLGLLAGAGMLGVGFHGAGQGALTGALGTGLGLGALAFLGTTTSALSGVGMFAAAALSGPFAPITLGIGALIGGLIGLFSGKGKLKKEQTQVLQDMERQLNLVQNAYDLHQAAYSSAIAQAEQIRQSYTQQQEQLSKGGSVGRVDPWVDALEQHINAVEGQRQNALAASANYGPAQFRSGGYVDASLSRMVPAFAPAMHFAAGGAVPAILHAGEYVLRSEAVQRMGVGNLNAINSGGGGGDIHLHINALDPQSFEAYLGGEGGRVLFRSIRRAAYEGRI